MPKLMQAYSEEGVRSPQTFGEDQVCSPSWSLRMTCVSSDRHRFSQNGNRGGTKGIMFTDVDGRTTIVEKHAWKHVR